MQKSNYRQMLGISPIPWSEIHCPTSSEKAGRISSSDSKETKRWETLRMAESE